MSGLNVIARTQHIFVEPASASVAVMNVGQPGPAGPPGPQGVPGPGGPGTTAEWARLAIVGGNGIIGTAELVVGFTKSAGSAGITLSTSSRPTVNKAGRFWITSCITISGGATTGWIITYLRHKRAGAVITDTAVVAAALGNGVFSTIPIDATFDMLSGDYVELSLVSSANGQNLDNRGLVCITEVPSNIGPTIIPPGGNTGQVLVKRSNIDYDVMWADPT